MGKRLLARQADLVAQGPRSHLRVAAAEVATVHGPDRCTLLPRVPPSFPGSRPDEARLSTAIRLHPPMPPGAVHGLPRAPRFACSASHPRETDCDGRANQYRAPARIPPRSEGRGLLPPLRHLPGTPAAASTARHRAARNIITVWTSRLRDAKLRVLPAVLCPNLHLPPGSGCAGSPAPECSAYLQKD